MQRFKLIACPALALALLAGCQASNSTAVESSGAAGPVIKNVDDYRKVRFADAMRGLIITDDAVIIDRRAARDVERAGADDALALGRALMQENDFTGAVGEFRRAILADADRSESYAALGDALICKKKDGMALGAYSTAVDIDPNDTATRVKLAETLNRTGDLDGWTSQLERVVEVDPAHGHAHARLAVARYYVGDREGAKRHAALAKQHGGAVPAQLEAMLNN